MPPAPGRGSTMNAAFKRFDNPSATNLATVSVVVPTEVGLTSRTDLAGQDAENAGFHPMHAAAAAPGAILAD